MNSADIFWNIEHGRDRRGMTVDEFVRLIGISAKTWNNYKTNPEAMRFGIAEKAAKVFEVPMQDITGRTYDRS